MNCKSNGILKGSDEDVQDYPIGLDPIQDENIDKSEFLCGDHLSVPSGVARVGHGWAAPNHQALPFNHRY